MPEARPGRREALASLAWRSTPIRMMLAAVPLWLLLSHIASRTTPSLLLAVITVAFAISAANPIHGLLLIAIAAPLSDTIAGAAGAHSVRIGDALVCAFLSGWLLRGLPDRRGPGIVAPIVAWLVALVFAWRIGSADGIAVLEGLGLVAATTMLFRRDPSLAIALPRAISSAAAMSAMVLFSRGGAPPAWSAYFVMSGCLALGMALRESGYWRGIWCGLGGACGLGGWLAGWRGAMTDVTATGWSGIAGVGLLAIWIAAAFVRTVRALESAPRDTRLSGAAIGALAFLTMRVNTRPPSTDAAGLSVFWLQFGLMTALAGSVLLNRAGVTSASRATSSSPGQSTRRAPHH